MRSGLLPIHSVDTMTWTSKMSGTPSSGVRVIAHTPHAVSTTVPVKTRNRFVAHQSRILLITDRLPLACESFRNDGGLHRAEPLTVPCHRHGRFPSAGPQHFAA